MTTRWPHALLLAALVLAGGCTAAPTPGAIDLPPSGAGAIDSPAFAPNLGRLSGVVAGPDGPVAGAQVTVHALDGEPLSRRPVFSDAQGRYTLGDLKPSGEVVVVKATCAQGGSPATLMAISAAPRADALREASLGPATTLVAKKLAEVARTRGCDERQLATADMTLIAEAIASAMDAEAAVAAMTLDDNQAARRFDGLLERDPALRSAVASAIARTHLTGLLEPTPADAAPPDGPSSAPLAEPPALPCFDDQLAAGWHLDHTWNGQVSVGREVTPASGALTLVWQTRRHGGLKLLSRTPVDTRGYQRLTFSLRATRSGQRVALQLLDGTTALGRPTPLEEPPIDAWRRYDLELSMLAGQDRAISGFMLTDLTGAEQPALYLDRIGLER